MASERSTAGKTSTRPQKVGRVLRAEQDNVVPLRGPRARATIECRDNIDFMRSLEKGSMKLIVTSPPYNIGKAYEQPTDRDLYVEKQAETIAEAARLLHPQGSICWQVGNH